MTTENPKASLRRIRSLLDKYDAVVKAQSELPPNATTGAISRQSAQVNYELVHVAPAYLRALLAVATIAKALVEDEGTVFDHSEYMWIVDKNHLFTDLIEALKQLD